MKTVLSVLLFFAQSSFGLANVNTLKMSISSQELEVAQVNAELNKLNYALEKAVRNKSKVETEMGTLAIEIENLNQQLDENTRNFIYLKNKLAQKTYQVKQGSEFKALQNLLSASSSAKAEQHFIVLNKLIKNDFNLITELKVLLNEINFQKEILLAKQKKLEGSQAKFQLVLDQLGKESAAKLDLIARARNNLKAFKEKLSRIRDNKNSDLNFIFSELFMEKKGALATPSQGAIQNSFGMHQIEGSQIKTFNRGVYFESLESTPVRSVASGKVALVENVDTWGLTIVIDHGDHYYSTYSNLKNSHLKIGDSVIAQANIGEAKKLYFEVRHFTEPQNPLEWLKGNKSEKN